MIRGFLLVFRFAAIFSLLLFSPSVLLAGNIDPDNVGAKFAWGENVGWINFEPNKGPGVTVTDDIVTGFAWSENAGWINLAPTDGGIFNDSTGALSGFAWAENGGWIKFSPDAVSPGVRINPSSGVFEGQAWGENVGWINFSSPSVTSRVKTSWRPQSDQQVCDVDASLIVDIYDIRAIAAARNTPAAPGDVRDVDGDGVITLNDARQCVLQCTNPRCAP